MHDALTAAAPAAQAPVNRLSWCAGVYDEATRVGMDWVIQQASQRGIRLVLVLANYWAMYGGIDQYNIWSFQAGSGAPCGQHHVLCDTWGRVCKG